MAEPRPRRRYVDHVHPVDRAVHDHLRALGRRLVTRDEVLELGGSDSLINVRREQRRWIDVQPAVYLVGLPPLSPHEERLAIILAVPQPAALSQLCAFVEWGMDGLVAAPIELTVAHSTHVNVRGAIVHRSRCDEGFEEKVPLVVTSVERTLLECTPRLPRITIEKALTSAWRRNLTTPEMVLAYLDEHGSRGRKGSAALAAIAGAYLDRGRAPGSVAEVVLLDLLRPELDAAGIEHPVRQFALALPDGTSATLDLAWPARRKAIEPAGVRWHGNSKAQAYDYRRRALARQVGWEIEPVAPVALSDQPKQTVELLVRFLLAPSLTIDHRERRPA